jgi:DNA-binding MarR family transcriptional regulator
MRIPGPVATNRRNVGPLIRAVGNCSVSPGAAHYHEAMSRAHHDSPLDPKHQLDPVLDFMRLLWSIEHGLQRMSKRMEGELGITGPQRLVLRVVGRFPDLSASELAHIVRLHPSTITGILQRLVARGYLERQSDPKDTRRARLRLKPQAVAHTRVSRGTVERAVTEALDQAGVANVRAARKVLLEIAQRLNQL